MKAKFAKLVGDEKVLPDFLSAELIKALDDGFAAKLIAALDRPDVQEKLAEAFRKAKRNGALW